MNQSSNSLFVNTKRPFSSVYNLKKVNSSYRIQSGHTKKRSWSIKEYGKINNIPVSHYDICSRKNNGTRKSIISSGIEHTREKFKNITEDIDQYKIKIKDIKENMQEILRSQGIYKKESYQGYLYVKNNPNEDKIKNIRIPLSLKECSLNNNNINIELTQQPNKKAKYSNLFALKNQKQKFLVIPDELKRSLVNQQFKSKIKLVRKLTNDIFSEQQSTKPLHLNPKKINIILNEKLVYHVKMNNKNRVLEILKENSSIVNEFDFCGKCPIHYAVEMSLYVITKILIYFGADLEASDSLKRTPLQISYSHNDKKIVKVF